MKKLIFILLALIPFVVHAQDPMVRIYTLENNQAIANKSIEHLYLPVEFHFTEEFDNLPINILDESGNIIGLNGARLGMGQLTLLEGVFIVAIEADGKLNPITQGDDSIVAGQYKLKIGSQNPISFNIEEGEEDRDDGIAVIKEELETDDILADGNFQPGNMYYDAMELAGNTDISIKMKILGAYGITGMNYKNNPFINDVFKEYFGRGYNQSGLPLISQVGNTDVTHFAAGLARFLAERTKEELNEAFFSKMKMQLNAYPELKAVFPKTSAFLNIIETYSYASVIQVLKEAFETDVQNLPQNLYKIKALDSGDCNLSLSDKKLDACQTRMNNLNTFFQTQDGRWIGLGMYTVKEAITASNPADLLKSITLSEELSGIKSFSVSNKKYTNYNVASSIELCNHLSQNLLSNEDGQIWINSTEFKALLSTKDAFTIYLGLLLAKEQEGDDIIYFYKSKGDSLIKFGDILISAHEKYSTYKPELISLVKNSFTAFNTANNAANRMIAATEKSVDVDPQTLYNYYRTFTNAVEPIAHNSLLSTFTGIEDMGDKYDMIAQYLNPSVDIVYHVSVQKYSAAIYDASILLDNITPKADFQVMNKSFLKYGTLISSVANAQSSDEVKNAIEASVLPVGGSSIKRNSNWSISVNAYVGGFYGKAYTDAWGDYEYDAMMVPIDSSKVKKNYQTYGLYAPIGVSFSKGSKKGWGLSLSLQIIDLGALVNFYLTEGDETALPSNFTIRLSNIFAPGAQLGLNIPKTPITVMGGFQFVPALYELDQISSSSTIVASNAVRWHIGLVVDIPMLNVKVWDFKK